MKKSKTDVRNYAPSYEKPIICCVLLICLVIYSHKFGNHAQKDAEKKLNETSDILSVDNENSKKAVSRLHDNDEILSQPSTTLSDAVTVDGKQR